MNGMRLRRMANGACICLPVAAGLGAKATATGGNWESF